MQVIHVEGTDMYELKSGYKDFDISLDQCSLSISQLCATPRAPYDALCVVPMLIGC